MTTDLTDQDIELIAELTADAQPAGARRLSPVYTLGRFLLAAHLTPKLKRRLSAGTCCAVIEVPGATWVEPTVSALTDLPDWNHVVAKSSLGRGRSREEGGKEVANILTRGGRVLGISQSPDQYLPQALLAAADVRMRIGPPSAAVLQRVISTATGATTRVPPDIAAGLGFDDILAAIRVGSSGLSCVRRLRAASEVQTGSSVDLVDVPLLEELHGYGAAMEWAVQLVADLDGVRRGEISFDTLDRCVVLSSEPGLGKTTFVRSLARSARMPLIATSVASWFSESSGYLDAVIKQIDAVFDRAAAAAPAVLFLDELDSVPSRERLSDRNREWWTPVITRLLTTLDGAVASAARKLVIIGATNYAHHLDPALIRPGRLSRVIEIGRPGFADLAGILRQHLGSDLPGADLESAAMLGLGATGADVTAWVKGARQTARAKNRPMTMADLLAQVAPEVSRPADVDRRAAVHEVGHAVVADAMGRRVRLVTLTPLGASGGRTVIEGDHDLMPTRQSIERQVVIGLAGRAAEEVICGEASAASGGGAGSDLERVTRLTVELHASQGLGGSLVHMTDPDGAPAILTLDPALRRLVAADLDRLYLQAVEIVQRQRLHVERVADALLSERSIAEARFHEILAGSPRHNDRYRTERSRS